MFNSNIHRHHIIVLDRGDYTSCTINLHGATVTSWKIHNQEMVFVSRLSNFTQWSHISGGIHFAFPVCGPWSLGPKNGFARKVLWQVSEGPTRLDTGDVYAILSLTDDSFTRSLWNYQFQLYYKISLFEKKLTFKICVENPSQYSYLEFFILQYSLMRVPHVSKCQLVGFQNFRYRDINRNNQSYLDTNESIAISEHTNRMYYKSPKVVVVQNIMKGGSLKIEKKQTKDINLWNPWIEGSMYLKNIDNDEYQYFIAVQAGMVSNTVRLEPWCCWSAFQSFEFIDAPKKNARKEPEDFNHFFDGYC